MRVSLFAAALVAVAAPALASDLRQLYKHADSDPTTFCNSWRCAWCARSPFFAEFSELTCSHSINHIPKNPVLYFQGALCEPGDYSGKNNRTEALAYCAFTGSGSKPVLESAAVAKQLGATLA